MTDIRHIFFDIGGVLGSNCWDREQRHRAVERFDLNLEDFQWRHEEVVAEWEEGRITLDEYLDIAVFNTQRPFSREEFVDFMYSQSVPDKATVQIARALSGDSRFTLMTLNNESEELNLYRIETFGISEIFEAFLSSCWLGVRKPMPRIYSRALGIAHAEPASSLFIDNLQQNLTPASSLGMNVILFKSASQLRSDLERVLGLEIPGV
ncbi:MAG TPA: HAD family hydrolase [Gemmatimonadaceae bacterium]|nr:HAD family hydrolase [Gemmatimonadaceae bacterium]